MLAGQLVDPQLHVPIAGVQVLGSVLLQHVALVIVAMLIALEQLDRLDKRSGLDVLRVQFFVPLQLVLEQELGVTAEVFTHVIFEV